MWRYVALGRFFVHKGQRACSLPGLFHPFKQLCARYPRGVNIEGTADVYFMRTGCVSMVRFS